MVPSVHKTSLYFAILASIVTASFPLIPSVDAQQTQSFFVYIEPLPDWAVDYAGNAMYDATNAWQDANPDIRFYQASSPEEANLIVQWIRDYGTSYMGEAIGGSVIQVGLGNSFCMGEWHPFLSETVTLIAKHELGHFLGFDHSSDPDSVMYHTLKYRYGIVETEESLAANYAWFVPVCTLDQVTSYWYQVEMDEKTYGFDVYFVPSKAEYDAYLAGNTFSYYSDTDCYVENYLVYAGICEGVAQESGLLIIAPEKLTNSLTRVKVQLLEVPSNTATTEIPTIKREPEPESFSDTPLTSPTTGYKDVQGTDFSVYTSVNGGTIDSIAVNPSDKLLRIFVSSQQDGSFTITLPRDLIDSREEGSDTEFVVFVDGYLADFDETSKNDNYRTLRVYFPEGTSTVDIVGTNVVPELGSMAVIVLAAGIVSSISIWRLVSSRAAYDKNVSR